MAGLRKKGDTRKKILGKKDKEMYQNIIFDVDGTIMDSASGILKGISHAIQTVTGKNYPQQTLLPFLGIVLRDGFMQLTGMTEEQAVQAVQVYRSYYFPQGLLDATPYAGIKELLQDLKAEGRILSIASSKPQLYIETILTHFGLISYFDKIVGMQLNDLKTKKDALLQQAKLSDSAVMVGDRKYDVLAGKSNGVATIGVLYGYGDRQELTQAGADVIVETVEDLRRVLME